MPDIDFTPSQEITNWSGDIRFKPSRLVLPSDETAICELVGQAAQSGQTIRPVGSQHSCSPIFKTSDILLSLGKLASSYESDISARRAKISANNTVAEIGKQLLEDGLAMENTGHIDEQTIAGAISTGTHGAGKHLTNISGQLHGIRLVDGLGKIRDFDMDHHPEMMQALKVSLGSMGIVTQVTLNVLPAYELDRRQYCASIEDCLYHLDDLMESNRNFAFYWYPRRDDVSIRTWNVKGQQQAPLSFAKLEKQYCGDAKDVLPTEHTLRYNELEYSLDSSVAVDCFQQIRKRIKEVHRKNVAWRVLFRADSPG